MQKNRGMLLESIINNTNEKYYYSKIAYIHKKNLDIKFKKVLNTRDKLNLQDARIYSKSTVDYYGVWQGRFICFEAKETEGDSFNFNNIRTHQRKYLLDIKNFGGISFYIIFFKKYEKFLYIDCLDIEKNLKLKKSLTYSEAINIGHQIELVFPGILNYIDCIKIS